MADPVRINGFYSSFDTEAVIKQLTAARQVQIQKLDVDKARADARQATIVDLASKFSSLLSRASALATVTSVSGKTTSVTGTGLAAAAGPAATPGSFTVAVTKLATGTSATGSAISAAVNSAALLSSSNLAVTPTAGTFTINGTAITIDPAVDSLDAVVTRINASVPGVTATITNDTNGRANILTLNSASAISLGAGGDTSNFLSATNLLASPGTLTRASTLSMARLSPSSTMASASWFGGPPAAGAHSFTINGTTISYNTASDSLNDVITRINASAAGVTARYDAVTDTVRLQQTKLGSLAIALADDGAGGNFLAKTGLLAATQAAGTNAEYSINGGPTQYAASNTVVAAPGVTLTLSALIDVGTPATVAVNQDTNGALNALKGFVTEFNNVMTAIDDATRADGSTTNNQSGLLSGDASIRQLKSTLRGLLAGTGQNVPGNFTNFSQIGLGFGAIGSKVGTTNTLQLDEAKFKTALGADPSSVQSLLSAFTLQGSLAPGGTGSISGLTGTYSGSRAGSYAITDNGSGSLTAVFTPADGGSVTTTSATVIAGGTNTTLIPGMTVQVAPVLVAGNHTVNVTTTSASVMSQIKTFLENQAGVGGMLAKREDAYAAVAKDITNRKDTIQARIDKEMENLRRKFTVMEQAQARAQTVLSSLQQTMAKTTSSNGN